MYIYIYIYTQPHTHIQVFACKLPTKSTQAYILILNCSQVYKPVCVQDNFMQVLCGFTCVSPKFEPMEGVLPVPAAFVGDIEYEIE